MTVSSLPRLRRALSGAQYDLDYEKWEERKPLLHEVAQEASDAFTSTKRGDDRITVKRADAPVWVESMVYAGHGNGAMLPDDWKYDAIAAACEAIAYAQPDDERDLEMSDLSSEYCDSQVDVYTGERYEWLSSNLTRSGYVDQARDDGLISGDTDLVDQVGAGQYEEAAEVFATVSEAIIDEYDDRISDWEDDEPDMPEDYR